MSVAKLIEHAYFVLQESEYEWWARGLRRWWQRGKNRVYAFWIVSLATSLVVFTSLTTNYLNWDRISDDFMPTNELSRAFLASFILVMDLMIVMQVRLVPASQDNGRIVLPPPPFILRDFVP